MNKKKIYQQIDEKNFCVLNGDASKLIDSIEDNSIKLIYGSPPYPNAKRNYRTWRNDDYIEEISPFLSKAYSKLSDDGFIVINVKANRLKSITKGASSERSLVVEKLMIHLKEKLNLYCVDIEIWIKSNPVPTGLRVACQDAYEYNLWFSKSPKWRINIDKIRRQYAASSISAYNNTVFKPRSNGLKYISKSKSISPNPRGALPVNVSRNEFNALFLSSFSDIEKERLLNLKNNIVFGAVSGKQVQHQAVQPEYLPKKYILACTNESDIVLDPWVGSGTTGVAALNHNRKFIGFDISQKFTDLAQKNIIKGIAKGNEVKSN